MRPPDEDGDATLAMGRRVTMLVGRIVTPPVLWTACKN